MEVRAGEVLPVATGPAAQSLGGGLARPAGSLMLLNSVLSTNSPGGDGYGSIIDQGYNVSSDTSITLSRPSLANSDPKLGPLSTNGGPTLTMALLSGSPAINLIPSNQVSFPPTDQRGVQRPQGKGADAGAFEFSITINVPSFALLTPSISSNA